MYLVNIFKDYLVVIVKEIFVFGNFWVLISNRLIKKLVLKFCYKGEFFVDFIVINMLL